ncbi:MAG: squalene synthase HpnC [Deltaproteobacteria bacterium]|nr:squalene synthase HpnC [Deltaproteobacteria bacterium]
MTENLPQTYPIDEVLMKKHWNLADAFRYCERLARNHYENFPVGSVLIPKELRPYVWAIYAFARRADDIADEDFPEVERLPALRAWQGLLEKSQIAPVNHPVFLAVKETIRKFQIPVQWLIDLVTAFKWDVEVKRYPTFKDVLYYCRHSANPVGRLVLYLFGYRDERLMLYSDQICSALQLANFWQDISVDLEKNRIYLPLEDLKRFQVTEAELFAKDASPRFRDLLRFEVERTEEMFREGAPLIRAVKGRLRLELKCTVLGGMGILKKVREADFDTLSSRPTFNKTDKGKILIKALFGFKRSLRPPKISSEVHPPEMPADAAPPLPVDEGSPP